MIRVWDRAKAQWMEEKVYGGAFVERCYSTGAGRFLTDRLLASASLSRFYGALQSARFSSGKVPRFIRDFSIPMEEYEEKAFTSFNDFFIRKFRGAARPFAVDARLPAFAEGRYLAFEKVEDSLRFPLKGARVTATELLGNTEDSKAFEGGPLLIARLCPVDYHRFHFPDDGIVEKTYRVPGRFHSVNPVALKGIEGVFRINERQVTILSTQNFGRVAYIEVGALMVGRIVQSHPAAIAGSGPFKRGEEKGYFLFGASTVILLGTPGSFVPDPDLVLRTKEETESFVRLGEGISKASS